MAGNNASAIYIDGSSFHSITSIFSPHNSFIIFCIRIPFWPTQEPTGSIFSFAEYTATLHLFPGSLETLFISISPSYISGISNSNSFLTNSLFALEMVICNALMPVMPVRACGDVSFSSATLYEYLAPLCERPN